MMDVEGRRPTKPQVRAVYDSYPPWARTKALALRKLIFQVATSTPGIGLLEETLKWGEPAYMSVEKRKGTTIRVAWSKKRPGQVGLYFNCRTNLVDTFRTLFPELNLQDNRAIVFEEDDAVPEEAIGTCIAAALTYHLWKNRGVSPRWKN